MPKFFCCCSKEPTGTPEEQASKKAKKELEKKRKAFEKRKNSLDSLKDGGFLTDDEHKKRSAELTAEEKEFEADNSIKNAVNSETPVTAQSAAVTNKC